MEPGIQVLERQTSWQQVKHAELYSDLLRGGVVIRVMNGKRDSPWISEFYLCEFFSLYFVVVVVVVVVIVVEIVSKTCMLFRTGTIYGCWA